MQPAPKPLRALIVEDESRYRDFLADVLREMDWRPVPTASAGEAMRAIQSDPPDLLLLDLNLPVIDGMMFLEQFRRRCPDVPVVIITGFGDLESARKAIRLGVADFLTKPCDLGEIERAIDRARRRNGKADRLSAPTKEDGLVAHAAAGRSLAQIERETIIGALRASGGNRSATAKMLAISRRALYNKMKTYRRDGYELP